MGALKPLALAATILLTTQARADPVTRWRPYTAEASARFGMPVDWIERVMRLESAGLTSLGGRPITSPKGAMGLMQLMPATWAAMRAACRLGTDPYDPHDNILAGTAYLRLMYDRFGYPGLFGAYDAGPGRYAAYLAGGTLPSETRAYLAAIGSGERTARPPVLEPPRPSIFAVRAAPPDNAPGPAAGEPPSLFVVRAP